MGTLPLTERQRAVLRFVEHHLRRYGYPPTVREIARHFGMAGPKGAKKHLDALVKKGAIERLPRQPRAIRMKNRPSKPGRLLPVLGSIRAGLPLASEENIEGYFLIDGELAPKEAGFFLRVKGESMIGAHIMDGDYVLIRRQSVAENGEIAAVLVDGEATLKYFSKKKDGIYLTPAHPGMKPIVLKEASVQILGKVAAVLRIEHAGIERKKIGR